MLRTENFLSEIYISMGDKGKGDFEDESKGCCFVAVDGCDRVASRRSQLELDNFLAPLGPAINLLAI